MATPLAYPVEKAGDAAGVSRTRIFEAIKNKELTASKAGKATIIEVGELQRWASFFADARRSVRNNRSLNPQ